MLPLSWYAWFTSNPPDLLLLPNAQANSLPRNPPPKTVIDLWILLIVLIFINIALSQNSTVSKNVIRVWKVSIWGQHCKKKNKQIKASPEKCILLLFRLVYFINIWRWILLIKRGFDIVRIYNPFENECHCLAICVYF